ncbi:hypothetical protein BHE74_00049093 [Ensete ventricosum]|nr:hypothetical protein GW17_00058176 [Ensete ventricosum]RWW45099.1 hypothetical protein BHE74_00049093 [Ensete ventricosum]
MGRGARRRLWLLSCVSQGSLIELPGEMERVVYRADHRCIALGCGKVCFYLRMEGMKTRVDRLLVRLVGLREGHPLKD